MIRFVIGLPGAGKTMFCVSKILDELVYTERFVVTNLQELRLDKIGEYLAKRCPDRAIDLDRRLLVIPKTETFQFFRFRSGGLELPPPPDSKMKLEQFYAAMEGYFAPVGQKPEWGLPVSYFLSEAHEFFPAKDWQDIGRAVKFYASKHRHLHDEVVVETQFPEQVEPNFRRLAQEFHHLQNHYKMSFGPFANRGRFERKVYLGFPLPRVATETASYTLDVEGVGSCYHTTGALGIMNRGAEASGFGRKRKLPWWSLWAFAALGVVAAVGVVWLMPKMIAGGMNKLVEGTSEGMAKGAGKSASVVAKSSKHNRMEQRVEKPEVFVTGYAINPDGPVVWLSDGSVLRGAADLREVRRNGVVLADGRVIRFAPRREHPSS